MEKFTLQKARLNKHIYYIVYFFLDYLTILSTALPVTVSKVRISE